VSLQLAGVAVDQFKLLLGFVEVDAAGRAVECRLSLDLMASRVAAFWNHPAGPKTSKTLIASIPQLGSRICATLGFLRVCCVGRGFGFSMW
jgi:hypothetical protein